MNKKTIILCVSLIGVFVIIVAVALSFLYSGTGESGDSLADDRESMLFSAVPSDASMVLKFQEFGRMLDAVAAPELVKVLVQEVEIYGVRVVEIDFLPFFHRKMARILVVGILRYDHHLLTELFGDGLHYGGLP